MSTLITNFFAKTKQNVESEKRKKNETKESEKFYKSCLLKCDNAECEKEKEEMKKKISELKEQINKIADAIDYCQTVILEEDAEIINLQADSTQCSTTNGPRMNFEFFSDSFDRDQLNHLKTISSTERGDSTFVCAVLKFLYAENLESVRSKTACGKATIGQGQKAMMSPEKKRVVQEIYDERLSSVAINSKEKEIRGKKLNKFINDAFTNIAKSVESKTLQNQLK